MRSHSIIHGREHMKQAAPYVGHSLSALKCKISDPEKNPFVKKEMIFLSLTLKKRGMELNHFYFCYLHYSPDPEMSPFQ